VLQELLASLKPKVTIYEKAKTKATKRGVGGQRQKSAKEVSHKRRKQNE
jgi:hypothetical protein